MNDDGGDDDEDVANQLTVELRLPIQAKRLLRFLLIPPEQVIVEPIRRRGGACAPMCSTGCWQASEVSDLGVGSTPGCPLAEIGGLPAS